MFFRNYLPTLSSIATRPWLVLSNASTLLSWLTTLLLVRGDQTSLQTPDSSTSANYFNGTSTSSAANQEKMEPAVIGSIVVIVIAFAMAGTALICGWRCAKKLEEEALRELAKPSSSNYENLDSKSGNFSGVGIEQKHFATDRTYEHELMPLPRRTIHREMPVDVKSSRLAMRDAKPSEPDGDKPEVGINQVGVVLNL